MPYRSVGKITHRAWFSPEEYKQLHEAARQRASKPKRKHWKGVSEQMHDYVLFMANTGLPPDEAARLEYSDVKIVEDKGIYQIAKNCRTYRNDREVLCLAQQDEY